MPCLFSDCRQHMKNLSVQKLSQNSVRSTIPTRKAKILYLQFISITNIIVPVYENVKPVDL